MSVCVSTKLANLKKNVYFSKKMGPILEFGTGPQILPARPCYLAWREYLFINITTALIIITS
jgi:hypothetical protein